MQTVFPEYYPPTEEELAQLSETAIVAVDANALLHAYRLSPTGANDWLTTLEALGGRLWVPYQAALEYQRNRLSVVSDQASLLSKLESKATSALEGLRSELTKLSAEIKRSRAVDGDQWEAAVAHAQRTFSELGAEARKNLVSYDDANQSKDQIHIKITNLLHGRVGPKSSDAELEDIGKEGKARYAREVPPGFGDAKKPDHRKYGDLVIWKALIAHSKQAKAPLVFITEDQKEDWWLRVGGRTVGPLPELRAEFRAEADKPFWMYSVAGFLRQAESFGLPKPSTATVEDAVDLESQNAEATATVPRMNILASALRVLADKDNGLEHSTRDELVTQLGRLLSAEFDAAASDDG